MRANKLSGFILIVLLAAAYTAAAGTAAAVDPVAYDRDSRTVRVSGRVDSGGKEKSLSIMIFNVSEDAQTDIYHATPDTVSDIVSAVDMVVTAADGTFSKEIRMKAESGSYTVWIGGAGISPPAARAFDYYSAGDIADALSAVNGAKDSPGQLRQLFEQYQPVFGIEAPLYGEEGLDKDAVFSLLGGKTHATVAALGRAFQEAVLVAYVNGGADAENIGAAMRVHGGPLGISTDFVIAHTPVRRALTAAQQAAVYGAMRNQGFGDFQRMRDYFYEKIVLAGLNGSDWTTIGGVFEHNKALIVIDTAQYGKIKDKDAIDRRLVGYDYTGLPYARTVFNQAVSEQLAREASGGGTGGSGGSGVSRTIAMDNIGREILALPEHDIAFHDLSSVAWAQESIIRLFRKGIVSGTGGGSFGPNEAVTREQVVKLLVLGFGVAPASGASGFSDVKETDWYAPYVAAAKALSLVNGSTDGSFGAGKPVTREDFAVLAYRFALHSGISFPSQTDGEFSDAAQIAGYAKDGVGAMKQAGIIVGKGGNVFDPKGSCTRAEAAVILDQLLKLAEKEQ